MYKAITALVFLTLASFKFTDLIGQSRSLNIPGLERKIDSLYLPVFDSTTPGIAITVLQDGKVIARKSYGMASLEHKIPFSHHSVVRFGYSETREFISIAAALLEEEGKLKFTDRVTNYFPGLPAWSDSVTISDLLNHSSGFIDEWASLALTQASMNNRFDKSQFLNLLYNQPEPEIEPRRGYMYSNSDYGLLRLILERASGQDLAKYLENKVFRPLGMNSTRMSNNKEAIVSNHAFSYVGGKGHYTLWLRDKTSPGGNYYIMTSAHDLEKWAAAHNNPNSFISRATQRLKQVSRPIPVLPGKNYPFGHKLKSAGNYAMTTHEGVNGDRYLSRIPAQKLTLICVSNYRDMDTLKQQAIVHHLLNHTEPLPVAKKWPTQRVPIDEGELVKFAGNYKWLNSMTFQSFVERRKYTEFRVQGDTLFLVFTANDLVPLTYVGNNIFKDPDFDVWMEFSPSADSTMKLAVHSQAGTPQTEFLQKETRVKPNLNKEQLKALTGLYYSKNLDFYLTIILNAKGNLVVKRGTIADKVLDPFSEDEFHMKFELYEEEESDCWLKFHTQNDKVSHFIVSHPRLMKLRFDRVGDAIE